MRHIKNIFRLTVLLLIFSCSNKSEHINAFHTAIDNNTAIDVLTAYFDYSDQAKKNNLLDTYAPLFDLIKTNMAIGPYEVLRYKDAALKWDDVHKLTSDNRPNKIYVVKYANGELMYLHFSGNKIASLLPIQKGNVITGWL